MTELKVKKRDGKTEDYSEEKVKKSLMKAGASENNAKTVASKITKWAKEKAKKGAVATSEIKNRVVEQMKTVNSGVAEKFRTFAKPSS